MRAKNRQVAQPVSQSQRPTRTATGVERAPSRAAAPSRPSGCGTEDQRMSQHHEHLLGKSRAGDPPGSAPWSSVEGRGGEAMDGIHGYGWYPWIHGTLNCCWLMVLIVMLLVVDS